MLLGGHTRRENLQSFKYKVGGWNKTLVKQFISIFYRCRKTEFVKYILSLAKSVSIKLKRGLDQTPAAHVGIVTHLGDEGFLDSVNLLQDRHPSTNFGQKNIIQHIFVVKKDIIQLPCLMLTMQSFPDSVNLFSKAAREKMRTGNQEKE